MLVARGEQQDKGSFHLVIVPVAVVVYVLCYCLLKRERYEYKRKEPRNGETQRGLQVKALD